MSQPLYEIIFFDAQGADPLPLAAPLKDLPGVAAVHLGRPVEEPSFHFLIIKYATPASRLEASAPERAALHRQVSWLSTVSFIAPDAELAAETDAALAAPCTEVVSIAAVVEQFTKRNMEPFKRGCLAHGGMNGFYAWGYGDVEEGGGHHIAREPLEMPGAVMLLGWESKGAHEAAKVKGGPIDSNLTLIESDNKGVFVHHVPFEKL